MPWRRSCSRSSAHAMSYCPCSRRSPSAAVARCCAAPFPARVRPRVKLRTRNGDESVVGLELRVLNWNIYKYADPGWDADLARSRWQRPIANTGGRVYRRAAGHARPSIRAPM